MMAQFREILFRFLHQLLERDLSMDKASGYGRKTAIFFTFYAKRNACPVKSGCGIPI
jgi:hypothetical protein